MNLREELLKEHSKRQTTKIARYIGNDSDRFNELVKLFLNGESLIAQRAGWILSVVGIEYPFLLKPWMKKLAAQLKKTGMHPAVKRNIVRAFQFTPIPGNLQGQLFDTCLQLMLSKDEPVAVKAFSMKIAVNIAKQNPGLKSEVKMVIEEICPYSSSGITSRAKCMLKELEKIQ